MIKNDLKIGDPVEVRFFKYDQPVTLTDLYKTPDETVPHGEEWVPATVISKGPNHVGVCFANGTRLPVHDMESIRIPAWKQALR